MDRLKRRYASVNRRNFLRTAGLAPAVFAFPSLERLYSEDTKSDGWRTFEVTTFVEVLKPSGPTRIWVPAALIVGTPYQRTMANTFKCEGGAARMVESKPNGLGIITAEFPSDVKIF